MLVYRIATHKRAQSLTASGRAARWNPNDVEMIYTASSRSLACLENVVHRSRAELNLIFSIMAIDCPKSIKIKKINRDDLPGNWAEYNEIYHTQNIGKQWITNRQTAILQVPSSIIDGETNYLLNPNHPDFKLISIMKTEPFRFDKRIKM